MISFNQPRFYSNASWNPNAITFADNITVGVIPHAIFINTNNTVFVAHRDTGHILIWLNGNVTSTVNISANLKTPSCLFVTADDRIYLDNQQFPSARVDGWSTSGTQLSPSVAVGAYCAGIFVDLNNSLYCSQDNQHRVVRKSLNSQVNTLAIVAGTGCAGSASNMLNNSDGIFVTANMDLYVADCYNDRIQRFRSGKLNATTVAGNGSSNGTITLNQPRGVVLDGDGYLFITDSGNHRIVGEDANGFRCLVGCNGSGSASNQLNSPFTMSFDTGGNMFVTDRYNNRIQKFLLTSSLRHGKNITRVMVRRVQLVATSPSDATTITPASSTTSKLSTQPNDSLFT